jgi:hypothetical protein
MEEKDEKGSFNYYHFMNHSLYKSCKCSVKFQPPTNFSKYSQDNCKTYDTNNLRFKKCKNIYYQKSHLLRLNPLIMIFSKSQKVK